MIEAHFTCVQFLQEYESKMIGDDGTAEMGSGGAGGSDAMEI